jgi:hypothetical protein
MDLVNLAGLFAPVLLAAVLLGRHLPLRQPPSTFNPNRESHAESC